ncbi:hypothetical protein [Prochlorococcus sp. MIT 1303]|uniref:hypothetical protein n=1 Tax=Prochlorococcus sp. MIT 1303 TaxID=1723647 RepID=UPI0007B3D7F1|nr:hypothetical protein [Prochlorococcus sp. MIT 1303]KZR65732.1 hypothetical protein PMIT1303_01181 [Prochlorococcus sp. MIT 1303]
MATIEQFKQIRASVSPEVQTELYGLLVQDLDAAVQRMIEIGNENEVSFTADEISSYLQEMDAEDEFDDIELDEATLAAVSGGFVNECMKSTGGGASSRENASQAKSAAITAKLDAEHDVVMAQRRVKAAQDALSAGIAAAQKRINEGSGDNFM